MGALYNLSKGYNRPQKFENKICNCNFAKSDINLSRKSYFSQNLLSVAYFVEIILTSDAGIINFQVIGSSKTFWVVEHQIASFKFTPGWVWTPVLEAKHKSRGKIEFMTLVSYFDSITLIQ